MRRLARMVALFAGTAAIAAMVALASPARAVAAGAEIKMSDNPARYEPEKITVKVGQPVTWINTGQTIHSVTLTPASAQNPKDVDVPKGAKTFDSGFMVPGGKFTYTFTVPGTYRYFCVPHEKAGMVGEVVVKK